MGSPRVPPTRARSAGWGRRDGGGRRRPTGRRPSCRSAPRHVTSLRGHHGILAAARAVGNPPARGRYVGPTTASPGPPGPPKLAPDRLRTEWEATLRSPRRHYGPAARALFALLDLGYGRARSLSKFKVLEVVARVPYQAWEHVAYVAVTHRYTRPGFARRIFDRVAESRSQQDNEQWHLLILEDLVEQSGRREGLVRFRVLPQVLAFAYYHLSWLLYVVRPRWSYGLNADFEDHAEHEYALFVQEHPDLEATPYAGPFEEEYGAFASLADLFRQIGHDERVHKEESEARMAGARFR